MLPKGFEIAANKGNDTPWPSDNAHPSLIIKCGEHFDKQILCIIHIGWINCRDAFHAGIIQYSIAV